jgi:hypothetical protein
MITFIKKLSPFLLVAILTHGIAGFFMNGDTDTNYLRFTPIANSGLIIGTSRAAQAICPDDITIHPNLFNACFSMNASPYGPIYSDYIKKIIDTTQLEQLFILSVDPWALSSNFDSIVGSEKFTEENWMVSKTKYIMYPNFEFIIDQYGYGWGKIILEHYRPTSGMFLHNNGWLEVDRIYNEQKANQRRAGKLKNYSKELKANRQPSIQRLSAFIDLVKWLKNFGNIVIVRIPVHPEFYELEYRFWPSFNTVIDSVCQAQNIHYWHPDHLNTELPFNDGHHMNRSGSHRFSGFLNVYIDSILHN